MVGGREGVIVFSLDMFDTGNLDSGGVGRIGGEHPTHAFFLRVYLYLRVGPASSFGGCAATFGTRLLRPLYPTTA
jgi:hypothetical protein